MRLPFLSRDTITLGTTTPPLPLPRYRVSVRAPLHAAIFGRSGLGKSKLLQSVYQQLVAQDHGVGIIEPHHDLSFDSLSALVADGFFRRSGSFERVIYLDWGNGAYVPFNVLAGDGDPHTKALNALEAMLRVWPELSEAPMFQTLFLSSLVALVQNKLPITYLYRLLSDAEFRGRCLENVTDPFVIQTFDNYQRLGRDQVQAAGSTLRRAFLLTFSPLTRNTLGQPDNWLDFRQIMDEGRSVIINLGNVNDHETRKLLGAMLMVQIEQAALSRTDLPPERRRPWTLLVDEWPSFAAQDKTIGTILSQTRKFNLRLWLAAQSIAQITSERLAGALENCRLTIALGLGRDSAEIQAKHIGSADAMAVKEEAHTDVQHNQYFNTIEQFEGWTQELQSLPARYAYVKLHDRPALKVKTPTVNKPRVDPKELAGVLYEYRRRYQRSSRQAEEAISRLERARAPARDAPPAYQTVFTPRPPAERAAN